MLCYNCMQDKGDAMVCPYCQAVGTPESLTHQMPPGSSLGNRYIVGRVIGEGGFGITYMGYDTVLQITVAIKEYYPYGFSHRDNTYGNMVSVSSGDSLEFYEKGKKRFLYEAQNLARFHNEPGIVSVINFLEENNTAYIVMEYLDGIDLRSYLRNNGILTMDQALYLLMPVMLSLEKIHRLGIIHRDISPDNLMYLRNGSVKLMDFGAARDFGDDNRSMSVMLKQGYAPEEQYRRNGEQGPWTDVYGMCATIYRCITGRSPDESLDRLFEDKLIRPSQLGAVITPALEDVLMYGMAVKKKDRCQSFSELVYRINQARQNPSDSGVDAGRSRDTDRDRPAGSVVNIKDVSPADSDSGKKKKKKIVLSVIAVTIALAILIGTFVIFNPFRQKLTFTLDDADLKKGKNFKAAMEYTLKHISASDYEYADMEYQGNERISENKCYKTDSDRDDFDSYLYQVDGKKYEFGRTFTVDGLNVTLGETKLKKLLDSGFEYGKLVPTDNRDSTQMVHLIKNNQFLEISVGPTGSDVSAAKIVALSYHNLENNDEDSKGKNETSATRPPGSSLQKEMIDIEYNGLSKECSFPDLSDSFGKPSELCVSYAYPINEDDKDTCMIHCFYIMTDEDLRLDIVYEYDPKKDSSEIYRYELTLMDAE